MKVCFSFEKEFRVHNPLFTFIFIVIRPEYKFQIEIKTQWCRRIEEEWKWKHLRKSLTNEQKLVYGT